MCLFIQSQEEKDVATVELKKIIYITFKGVGDGGGGNSERKLILVLNNLFAGCTLQIYIKHKNQTTCVSRLGY